MDGNEKYIAIV